MKKYRIAFRIFSDRGSKFREVAAADRETAQYIYFALQSRPELHVIELWEWKPGDKGVLGYYAPGYYVVLLASE